MMNNTTQHSTTQDEYTSKIKEYVISCYEGDKEKASKTFDDSEMIHKFISFCKIMNCFYAGVGIHILKFYM